MAVVLMHEMRPRIGNHRFLEFPFQEVPADGLTTHTPFQYLLEQPNLAEVMWHRRRYGFKGPTTGGANGSFTCKTAG